MIRTIAIVASFASLCLCGETPLRWGEFGYLSKWERYPYEVEATAHPEIRKTLPSLTGFPKMLDLAKDPKVNGTDRNILLTQLRTLSRCDFQNRLSAGADPEAEYLATIGRWREWWEQYGKELATRLPAEGKRYPAAWKKIAPSPYLDCPGYLLLLPDQWSMSLTFRSGDYECLVEETIDLQVTSDSCHLKRHYKIGWSETAPRHDEEWKALKKEEAQEFLATLIYTIDHPWFFSSDELFEGKPIDEKAGIPTTKLRSIRGRPAQWVDYYPSSSWSGILNAEGKVIINDDPASWHTIDPKIGAVASLDDSIGVVFRVMRDRFPDPAYDPDNSRWQELKKNK